MKQSNNRKIDEYQHDRSAALRFLRKSVMMRAALVIVVILLSIALVFSLTVAWYTNVVQSGGLTFSAEKWDFDGDVTIDDDIGPIYPGSRGIVPMTIKNNGDILASASVTVSKEQMDLQMKQRIYFYVDTNLTRYGEQVDRVYVSNSYSYTYTLFPKSEIIINNDLQNAPALRWEWVYDVLGFYVIATNPTSANNDLEYIRPIVYDYDETKTTFTAADILDTIDGSTTPEEYLAKLSHSDGFKGTLTASEINKNDGNFYPISVNEQGYGVWAYFCNYSEIETNIIKDTEIGQNGLVNCAAKVFITGQNVNSVPLTVNTEDSLLRMIDAANGNLIQLSNDITLSDTLTLSSGTRAMIDLNGYTLKSNNEIAIKAAKDSTLMLQNGKLVGSKSSNSTAVYSAGANVTINNVTVSDIAEGIKIRDNEVGKQSSIYIANSTITAEEDALWIYGNADSENKTSIVIENSNLVGKSYAGVLFNGTYWGTETYIKGSTISGYHTSIYHPQRDSTLNVVDSNLEGFCGLVVKGGIVNVEDCIIKGTGTTHDVPAENGSGWSNTGDGIYLEGNYEWTAKINILGSKTKISKTHADAMAVRNAHFDKGYSEITVTGGQYDTDVSIYCNADAYTVTKSDNWYTVSPKS